MRCGKATTNLDRTVPGRVGNLAVAPFSYSISKAQLPNNSDLTEPVDTDERRVYGVYVLYIQFILSGGLPVLLTLDHASGAPLYQQIVEQIRGAIIAGRLVAGDALPSIRQLAADLVISVITTKRAYQELEGQGLIITLPGRGTFVAEIDATAQQAATEKALAGQLDDLVRQARALGLSETRLTAILSDRWHATTMREEPR